MIIRISTCVFVLIASAVGAAAQNTIQVPQNQPTIQAAIDIAQNNDVVLVAPGTYQERIDFKGKAIEVRGAGGAASTTIDGQGGGAVVTFKTLERSNSRLVGFTIRGGLSATGGGITMSGASPTLESLVLTGNSSTVFGAAIYGDAGASPRVYDCVIRNNMSQAHAGAIAILGASTAVVENTVMVKNSAPIGGACYLSAGTVRFVGCTVADNSGSQGGAFYQNTGTTAIENCILWNNTAPFGGQIFISSNGGTVNVAFSNVQGGRTGTGNINSDPLFVSTATTDYHLQATSPCIDAGDATRANRATDFDSNVRVNGSQVDMGADEFAPHLYYTGSPAPGGTLRVNLVGAPGTPVVWGASGTTLPAPVSIPGISGQFFLGGAFAALPLGSLPVTGATGFNVSFPASFPASTFFTQALFGTAGQPMLTPLETVIIQ